MPKTIEAQVVDVKVVANRPLRMNQHPQQPQQSQTHVHSQSAQNEPSTQEQQLQQLQARLDDTLRRLHGSEIVTASAVENDVDKCDLCGKSSKRLYDVKVSLLTASLCRKCKKLASNTMNIARLFF